MLLKNVIYKYEKVYNWKKRTIKNIFLQIHLSLDG